MDKDDFAGLLAGVQQMKRHLRGHRVAGARVARIAPVDARKIRRISGLSQSEFSQLIGVSLKTLQNWEQERTVPTGPARALLKIVAADPKAAIAALHAE